MWRAPIHSMTSRNAPTDKLNIVHNMTSHHTGVAHSVTSCNIPTEILNIVHTMTSRHVVAIR